MSLDFVAVPLQKLFSTGQTESGAALLPVIVRIAGLPGTALSSLGSTRLLTISTRLNQIQQELKQTRSGLADIIASQLSKFSPRERRFLLAARRDCFNHRDLSKHVESSDWRLIESIAPDLASRQRELQEESKAVGAVLEGFFEQELMRELEALYSWATVPRFLRGLALSSPNVVQALRERYARSATPWIAHAKQDRRQRKLDQTLLRFVTRSAAKLSPNSTLTVLALGRIEADAEDALSSLETGPVKERSWLHLDRIYLDQLQELLFFVPEIRALCKVTINDTLEEIDGNVLRWIKPRRWQIDEKSGQLVHAPLSVAKARIDAERLSLVRECLAQGADHYGELSNSMSSQAEEPRAVEGGAPPMAEVLDGLIEIGLLQLVPPWKASSESSGERDLLGFLQTCEIKSSLVQEFQRDLSRLVELEMEFPVALHPDRCLLEMRQQLDRLRESAGKFPTQLESPALPPLTKANRPFHESVFLLKASPDSPKAEGSATFLLARKPLEGLYRIAQALYRFTELFNHRHDVLHSLEHFWRIHFPDERALPALEFFRRILPLWKQYIAFDRERRHTSAATFNPYDLPQVHSLKNTRTRIHDAIQELFVAHDSGYEIPLGALEALVQEIPDLYSPQVGPSGLVQPLRHPKGHWVLNRLLEGTGRYSNRYISALPPELGKAFAAQLADRAHIELEGETAELLDLMCIRGGFSEVHHPQTPWLLEAPGDKIEVPDTRKVRLGELRVHFDKRLERITLRNGAGRRLLPVHLTSLNHIFLPSVLRFLSVFGPYEVRQALPRSLQVAHYPGCLVSERVTCDRLVLSRKRWEFAAEAMSDLLAASSSRVPPHEFYLTLQAWREKFVIPREVYIYEKIHSPRENLYHYKPQFMDLTSPLMTQLLSALLKEPADRYIMDEALPSRDQLTADQNGLRAMELQFEDLNFKN